MWWCLATCRAGGMRCTQDGRLLKRWKGGGRGWWHREEEEEEDDEKQVSRTSGRLSGACGVPKLKQPALIAFDLCFPRLSASSV